MVEQKRMDTKDSWLLVLLSAFFRHKIGKNNRFSHLFCHKCCLKVCIKVLKHHRCAVAWSDGWVYAQCCAVHITSGQEGRNVHASTRVKTRLGVRQNTGPLPPAASVRHTAGTPLLLLVCRNRNHHKDAGRRRGCRDKRSSSRHHQPAPAVSICLELQPSWSVVSAHRWWIYSPLSWRPKAVALVEGESVYHSNVVC